MRFLFCMIIAVCAFTVLSAKAQPSTPPLLQKDIQQLPANYLDGWSKLEGALQSAAENIYNGSGDKVFALNTGTKLGSLQASQALKVYNTLNAVYNGQWDKLAGQAAEDFINNVWPLFGSYMALHGAVKTSFEAILAKWSQELYETKAYRDVVKVMNDAVLNQAKDQQPYLPSTFLRPGTSGYQKMKAVEDRMFTLWLNTDPSYELAINKNKYILIHVFGKAPKDDREVFDGFLNRAVLDQQSYIMTTYQRVREDTLREAMRKFYEQTVAELKKKQKMLFYVTGTRDNYGGKPLDSPAATGDILAFESSVFVPYVYNGELVRLTWQVYKQDGTPVEGLFKNTRITDGDKVHNAGMRFRIDSLPDGGYYAELSRCIKADCESARQGFTVGSRLSVSRVYLSQDADGTRRINRDPLSREARFLQADYTGGAEVSAKLIIRDSSGKTVHEEEKSHSPSGGKGRLGFPLENVPLGEGVTYKAEVAFKAKNGQEGSGSISFTPKFYSAEISGPSSVDNSTRNAYNFKVSEQMVPPFRIDTGKNAGEVSQLNDSMLYFTPKAGGSRTLAVVIADSQGRRAIGFKQVNVIEQEIAVSAPAAQFQPKMTYMSPAQPQNNFVPNNAGYDEGRRRLAAMLDRMQRDYIPQCMRPYMGNYTSNVIRDTNSGEIAQIGVMDMYALQGYEKRLRDASLRKISEMLNNSDGNSCDREWVSMLSSKGLVSRSLKNSVYGKGQPQQGLTQDQKIKALSGSITRLATGRTESSAGSGASAPSAAPQGTYYAVMAMESKLLNPDSCYIMEGKPDTGLYKRYRFKYNKNDPDSKGVWTYRRWVAAAGPGHSDAARRFCDDLMSGRKHMGGIYTPWTPTGSDGNFQMEQKEYIMPLPR